MSDDFAIREYRPEDEDFVYHALLNSFRRSHFRGPWPTDIYYKAGRYSIDRLVGAEARWGCRTIMAWSPADAGSGFDLYGYAIVESGFDRPVVHYVYVKDAWRRRGFARRLLAAAGIDGVFYFTLRSTMYNDVKDNLYREGLFRPELLWDQKPEPVAGKDGRPKIIIPQRSERRARQRGHDRRGERGAHGNASGD